MGMVFAGYQDTMEKILREKNSHSAKSPCKGKGRTKTFSDISDTKMEEQNK